MEKQTFPATPSDLNAKYEDAIRRKLDALLRTHGYSQVQFCEMLKKRGLDLGGNGAQGNLSYMLKGRKRIPLSLIVHVCEIFNITLADLVDENFGGAKQVGGNHPVAQVYSDDLLQLIPCLGDAFVTDPSRPEFQGYLQTYHVYMKPTLNFVKRLQTGLLTLEADGSFCKATLQIHCDERVAGEQVCKFYQGRAIISTSADAVYVLLSSSIEGDLTVLSFRHSHRPHTPLNCRIAAVLTNEAGEFHAPTVNRLFLSRVPIAEEHFPLLVPHLYLNGKDLAIRADALAALREEWSEYAPLIDHLTQVQPTPTYYWTEEYVMGTGRFFLTNEQLYYFLTRLRGVSQVPYQNKASHTADLRLRNLLLMLGYYSD